MEHITQLMRIRTLKNNYYNIKVRRIYNLSELLLSESPKFNGFSFRILVQIQFFYFHHYLLQIQCQTGIFKQFNSLQTI